MWCVRSFIDQPVGGPAHLAVWRRVPGSRESAEARKSWLNVLRSVFVFLVLAIFLARRAR